MYASHHVNVEVRGQLPIVGLSTMCACVSWIEPRLPGLMASAFIYQVVSLALKNFRQFQKILEKKVLGNFHCF